MPIRRSGPPSRYWVKPFGLSVSIHLAALAAIPALLGLGVFALSSGNPRPAPKVHELRFEMSRLDPDRLEASDPTPAEEPLAEPEPSPQEEWPVAEESMDELIPEPQGPDPIPVAEELPPQDLLPTVPSEVPTETEAPTEPQPSELEPETTSDPVPVLKPQPVDPEPEEPEATPAPKTWSPLALTQFCPEPRYPSKARRRKQAGAVVLELTIEPDGTVSLVTVVESSGYAILDRAAEQTLGTWRFQPAPKGWSGGRKKIRRRILFRLPK